MSEPTSPHPESPAPNTMVPLQAPPNRGPARIIGVLAAIGILGGGGYAVLHWGKESTDNAFVEGHVVSLGARVPGTVKEVLVTENQAVKAGDPLVRLDDADLLVRERVAEADLAAAEAARDAAQAQLQALTGNTAATLSGAAAGVDGARAATNAASSAVEQARAALSSAKARAEQAAADHTRADALLASGSMTKQAYDALVTADIAAQATLAQARAGLDAALQNVVSANGRMEEARARYASATTGDAQVAAAAANLRAAEARVEQARANVDAAKLNVSYTTLTAPYDAVVARKSAEPGQVVGAGTAMVGLVGTREVWVTANFKETQVEDIAPGQTVDVEVDGISSRTFEGTVQGLSGASGARFSMLPPDNASGNFTKVVQRIPVRIDLPPDAVGVLRPGMSAYVTVHVK